MYQEWTDNRGVRRRARIDAPILQFVELIGEDETAQLLLHFGGAPAYFARRPQRNNTLLNVISRDSLEKLAIHFGAGRAGSRIAKLPLGTLFLIRHMHTKGVSICEIARRLHITDHTIRQNLRHSKVRENGPDPDKSKEYELIYKRIEQ